MSVLPELTDEQIDAAWTRGYLTPINKKYGISLNRGCPSWRELRAAFPKPKPPEPFWEGGAHHGDPTITVGIGGDGSWIRLDMPQVDDLDGECGLDVQGAREMAVALHDAIRYVEANR